MGRSPWVNSSQVIRRKADGAYERSESAAYRQSERGHGFIAVGIYSEARKEQR